MVESNNVGLVGANPLRLSCNNKPDINQRMYEFDSKRAFEHSPNHSSLEKVTEPMHFLEMLFS